ncbi:MAG: hypothetical protein Q8P16_01785 [bacterium]|nr:hypothetical protein [bacterium]
MFGAFPCCFVKNAAGRIVQKACSVFRARIGSALFIAALLFFAVAPAAEAATFDNPLDSPLVLKLLEGFVKSVIYVGTPALVVLMVWTGFLFASARANPQRLTHAKDMFVRVLIGAVLLLGLWTIATLVGNTFAGLSAAAMLVVLGFFLLWVLFKK